MLLEIFSSYWIVLSSLNESFCFVLLNLVFFFHVCCLLEACSFLKGNRGNRSEGEGRLGTRRNREREGYGLDVLFEEKIYFQLKEEKVQKTNPQNDRKYLYMKDQKIKL